MSCCGPRNCNNFDDDREGLSDADLAKFGGDDISCPSCGATVYHDASQCNRCGHAMTEASLTKRTPAWIPMLAAGAALGIVLMFVLRLV